MRYSSVGRFIGTKVLLFFMLLGSIHGFASSKPRITRICESSSDLSVSIYWIPFNDTCDAFVQIDIYAYKKSSPHILVKIDSVMTRNTFSYTSKAGAGNLYLDSFYVSYITKCSGNIVAVCSASINTDFIPPNYVNPDSISVHGKKTIIGWKPSSSKDTKAYVVYLSTPGVNIPIDTVYGLNSDIYIDSTMGAPDKGSIDYTLAVLDSCDNVSRLSNAHATIFLSAKQDSCARTINLSWSPYVGWPVDSYTVFCSIDGGLHYYRVAKTPGTNTTFRFAVLRNVVSYVFYVRAHKGGSSIITSTSNILSVPINFLNSGNVINLSLVSVDVNQIRLEWHVPTLKNIASFMIEGSTDSVHYSSLANITVDTLNDYSYLLNDAVLTTIHYFKIVAIDFCGNKLTQSNISLNIVLHVSNSSSGRLLRWNNYRTWKHKVLYYIIYRSTAKNDSGSWLPITKVNGDTNAFLDIDSIDAFDNYGICYRVVAVGTDTSFEVPAISYSQTACTFGSPIVHMPNAFVRGGVIGVYKPITLYADLKLCSMRIYNRWGEEIVSIDDLEKGWDGTNMGKKVPEGVYFYSVEIYGIDKSYHLYRGTFTVL